MTRNKDHYIKLSKYEKDLSQGETYQHLKEFWFRFFESSVLWKSLLPKKGFNISGRYFLTGPFFFESIAFIKNMRCSVDRCKIELKFWMAEILRIYCVESREKLWEHWAKTNKNSCVLIFCGANGVVDLIKSSKGIFDILGGGTVKALKTVLKNPSKKIFYVNSVSQISHPSPLTPPTERRLLAEAPWPGGGVRSRALRRPGGRGGTPAAELGLGWSTTIKKIRPNIWR